MKLFLTKLPLPRPGGEKERMSERCTLGSADQVFLQVCVFSPKPSASLPLAARQRQVLLFHSASFCDFSPQPPPTGEPAPY